MTLITYFKKIKNKILYNLFVLYKIYKTMVFRSYVVESKYTHKAKAKKH